MKTLDEAFEAVAIHVDKKEPAEKHAAAIASAFEIAYKFDGIREDLDANEGVLALLDSITDKACCIRHAALSACMLGIQIGMEMEKP